MINKKGGGEINYKGLQNQLHRHMNIHNQFIEEKQTYTE